MADDTFRSYDPQSLTNDPTPSEIENQDEEDHQAFGVGQRTFGDPIFGTSSTKEDL
jgi:hypothetical protein